jgi:phosphatidylserine/phosphatidylglycerophosphate/cardiolipin synthase-like enzyme
MAKRRSSSSSSKSSSKNTLTPQLVLVLGAIVLVMVLVFGFQGALQKISEITGLPLDTTPVGTSAAVDQALTPQTGATSAPSTGGGDYFTVYFTAPETFTGDETTGGIEMHLIDLINNAQSSIYGAAFEFNLQDVADALIAAHERGVDVKLVYDDEHTMGEDDPQMQQMLDAGIPGTPDERSAFMHNKFWVIDQQVVWFGSWNLTTNDTFRNNNNAIVIRSQQMVQNYTTEFNEMFGGAFGPTSPADTPNPTFTMNGINFESYFASEDEVMPALVNFVNSATQTVHFLAFSYTDDSLAQAMMDRAAAGATVIGVFESRGANTESSSCPPMLQDGLDVRLDANKYTFHHKVVIIDSKAVAIGSFNFSNNASSSNDENLAIIYDPAVAALYEQEFNKQYEMANKPSGDECLAD